MTRFSQWLRKNRKYSMRTLFLVVTVFSIIFACIPNPDCREYILIHSHCYEPYLKKEGPKNPAKVYYKDLFLGETPLRLYRSDLSKILRSQKPMDLSSPLSLEIPEIPNLPNNGLRYVIADYVTIIVGGDKMNLHFTFPVDENIPGLVHDTPWGKRHRFEWCEVKGLIDSPYPKLGIREVIPCE